MTTAATRDHALQAILAELRTADHVDGCALMTNEGLVVAHALADDWVTDAGALSSACWGSAHRLARVLGMGGGLGETLLTSDAGALVIKPVGGAHHILVLAPAGVTIGMVRVASERAAARLREHLFDQ